MSTLKISVVADGNCAETCRLRAIAIENAVLAMGRDAVHIMEGDALLVAYTPSAGDRDAEQPPKGGELIADCTGRFWRVSGSLHELELWFGLPRFNQ